MDEAQRKEISALMADTVTPVNTPPSSRPSSPLGFQMSSLPNSKGASPTSTPGSSRPPSPLLKAMNNLTMNKVDNGEDVPDMPQRRPSMTKQRRPSSPAMAPFLAKFDPLDHQEGAKKNKVAVIGSGSWGTALAILAATNAATHEGFDETVNFWVRQKDTPEGPLTEVINSTHENARYLPNIKLPHNLVAVPQLRDVVKGANLILFCVPHQFLPPVIKELRKPGILVDGARAISAVKGVEVDPKAGTISTYPDIIEKELGIPCSALGGANVAIEVAREDFCETTIGVPSPEDAQLWHAVFDTEKFRVHCVEDVAGVSLLGALKNVVALAAGFVDGGGYGGNTKAAIIRAGLTEMTAFTSEFFPTSQTTTASVHSAGVADLITTSFGGRNRKCAEAFVKTGKSFDELEEELLGGQKLQGTLTSDEIHDFLEKRGRLEGYPLFEKVWKICHRQVPPEDLFSGL